MNIAQAQAAALAADRAWTAAYQPICPKGVWPGDFRYSDAAKGAPGSELRRLHDAFVKASADMSEAFRENNQRQREEERQRRVEHSAALAREHWNG